MALPLPANTTCDIYRTGVVPPGAPALAGVSCYLRAAFAERNEVGEGRAVEFRYTHVMLVDREVDVRDDQDGNSAGSLWDTVWIPDQNGTRFEVRYVERIGRSTPLDHRKVYLDRKAPSWPTNEL
jgi:hypothetical protein